MLLSQMFQKYLDHVKLYCSQGTYHYYNKCFKLLNKAFMFLDIKNNSDIRESLFDDLNKYFIQYTVKKNNQINSVISSCITVFKYFDINIPKRYKLRSDRQNFKYLDDNSISYINRYLKQFDNEMNYISWKLSVYLPLDTGVRMNELINIKSKNVDLKTMSIFLETTKNGKKRYVLFGNLTLELIKLALSKEKEYLIWNYALNKQMKLYSIYHFYDRMNNHLKFKQNVTAHRLRKTFATNLLKMGCPITTISKLLGHSDIKQTMVYLEIDNKMLIDDYEKYYPYKKEL